MQTVTFTQDYDHPRDALTTVRYVGGRQYAVTAEVAKSAREAGALKKEQRRGRDNGAPQANPANAEA